MFRSVLLAAALAATAHVAPATASSCVATADQPVTAGATVLASGSLTCGPAWSVTLTVCIESLRGTAWRVEACHTEWAYGSTVTAGVSACVLDGAAPVRTVAAGTSSSGEYAYAASVPALAPGFGSCGP